jgi:hypothetical protein
LIPFIGELTFDFTDRWSRSKHNAIRLWYKKRKSGKWIKQRDLLEPQ